MIKYLIPLLALLPSIAMANNPYLETRTLSSELAMKAVQEAVAACNKKGYKTSSALVNRDGTLQALLRNPLAGAHTVETSRGKAFTAASLQVSTKEVLDRTDLSNAPGILIIQGGLPIIVGGHFYGAIGVSGATTEDDEACSQAGIDAVSETLEFAD